MIYRCKVICKIEKQKFTFKRLSADTDKQNHRGQIVESVTSGKDEKLFGIFFIITDD